MYLAIHQGRPCRVTDVAAEYGISRNHLLKVALKLGRLGYLITARGRAGGIALGRRPEDIRLGDVVRHMEDGFALVECMHADGGFASWLPAAGSRVLSAGRCKPFSPSSTMSLWLMSSTTGPSWPNCLKHAVLPVKSPDRMPYPEGIHDRQSDIL